MIRKLRGQLGRLTRLLLLPILPLLLLVPATDSNRALAQEVRVAGEQAEDWEVAGEWEITVEVVDSKIRATWIGRVWENNAGVETLYGEPEVRDISADCEIVGDPVFGTGDVTFDGVDDSIRCKIPDFRAIFATMHPKLVNCRCRYEGPPYASADVSPIYSTTAQTLIYHPRLHLEVMERQDVADLELVQSISDDLAQVGSTVVFSMTVTNQGPNDASAVRVEDQLPSGYSYVGDNSSGKYNAVTGIWGVGSVAGGASATLQISATVNITGNYINYAQVATSNMLDPDSTPGNDAADEDDDASAAINPNAKHVRIPLILTGDGALSASVASAEAGQRYGMAQLTLQFNNDMVSSWQSNLFSTPQVNGVQIWGGYNAPRYTTINAQDGFANFLADGGFWDVVQPEHSSGFLMWESEAQPTYVEDVMEGFALGSGTYIYVGHNPETNSYFEGTIRAAAVDPGCRGH